MCGKHQGCGEEQSVSCLCDLQLLQLLLLLLLLVLLVNATGIVS
jgi:hypothetical protein